MKDPLVLTKTTVHAAVVFFLLTYYFFCEIERITIAVAGCPTVDRSETDASYCRLMHPALVSRVMVFDRCCIAINERLNQADLV